MRKLSTYSFVLLLLVFFGCKGNPALSKGAPIDSTAIKEQQQQDAQAKRDSLRNVQRAEALAEYNRWPLIPSEEVAILKPVLRKWLDFYKIDLLQMRYVRSSDWEPYVSEPDTLGLDYRKFNKKDDSGNLAEMDYSPNRQRYIDVGIACEKEADGKYHCVGWDDCQRVYLVDRKARKHYMALFFGTSGFAEAAFWKNNDEFVVVGYMRNTLSTRSIWVYDLKNITLDCYELLIDKEDFDTGYMKEVNLKEKGIISDY